MLTRSLWFVIACAFSGCATGYLYTRTGMVGATPRKAPGCEFRILTTPPTEAFDELGVLEVERTWHVPAGGVGDLKLAVQDDVCAAGGDAIIAIANNDGLYPTATVIRFRAPASSATSP